MNYNYFKRAAFLAATVAFCAAGAQAGWRNLNNEVLLNPSFIPGWSGAITAVGEGVAECYEGAFDLYQVVNDCPAGKYTLTVNAFTRDTQNPTPAPAYIYINGVKAQVAQLNTEIGNLAEAAAAFAKGEYAVSVSYDLSKEGPLTVGIMAEGGYVWQWTAFDNFKLEGPNGEVALVNADFAEGFNLESDLKLWEMTNFKNSPKKPDVNKAGGVFRKTNASPYNFGQRVELKAGKYRLGIQAFNRYAGGTTTTGGYYSIKGSGNYEWIEKESALDMHNNGTENKALAPYLYVTDGGSADYKPISEEDAKLDAKLYIKQPIMSLFDEKLDSYPCNLLEEAYVEGTLTAEGFGYIDSGWEYQAARLFVAHPELYRNYLEFTLTEPKAVWIGYAKDENEGSQFWNPFRDITLEVWEDAAGTDEPSVNPANQEWRILNNEVLLNPSFIPGWSGAITAVGEGVAECYEGAFDLYQVVNDCPAGKYTLSVNAFTRDTQNPAAAPAYIYINGVKAQVAQLNTEIGNLAEAAAAFAKGEYAVSVSCNLSEEGPVTVGIMAEGGYVWQWTAFDNFKLEGPNGEVALVNADFVEGFNLESDLKMWEMTNFKNSPKKPDVNKAGGVYRKTNASPYNFGQRVELEAGTYRIGIQAFNRYAGGTTTTGGYYSIKGSGNYEWIEKESALDMHNNGTENKALAPYLYVTDGGSADYKPISEEDAKLDAKLYIKQPIMSLFDEKLDSYPCNLLEEAFVEGALTAEGFGYIDSGWEYQAARLFVAHPELYRNYLEFTLTEPTTVWIGYAKDENEGSQFWNPFRDFTLEKKVGESNSINTVVVDNLVEGPVEYYNIQGMRVNNPVRGKLYIVKQGNKASKVIY